MSPPPILLLRSILTLLAALLVSTLAGAADEVRADVRALRTLLPQVHISIDARLGVARHIATADGFLSGPAVVKAAAPGADRAVRSFISTWPSLFGGDATILDSAAVVRDDVTAHSGLHTKVWQQTLHGIPVHHGVLVARTTRQDDLVAIGSGFVPQPDKVAAALREHTVPAHASAKTLAALFAQTGTDSDGIVVITDAGGVTRAQTLRAAGAVGEVSAHLVWFPRAANDLRLAWSFLVTERTTRLGWLSVVDAQSLEILARIRLTSAGVVDPARLAVIDAVGAPAQPRSLIKAASSATAAAAASSIALRVFTSDSPTPLTPGHANSADSSQPPEIPRSLVTLTSLDATASPSGWITGAKETRGSNVDAHLDINGDDIADTPRPLGTGSSPVTFDFPLDLALDPSTYRSAAVTNLFYWCNFAHDRLYQLGFTASAGNFQGSDAVQADAQDGSDTNNANFSTPPDGTAPRMQMFIFTLPNPDRDSSLDATVILHEYVHGLTHRLVGGGVSGNLDALQSTGMGEGWSDFYALCLLSEAGDDPLGTYAVGSYLTGNYFRGIRNYPYVVEPAAIVTPSSLNPLTFSNIITDTEVHDMGEVWCQTLWECRGELIAKHGAVAGNTLMLQLVTDGLKLTPATPTFTEARDAILQADVVATGGANATELWRGFAKRGLGFGAVAGTSDDTALVVESFEFSAHLRVSNAAGLSASGPMGGPFDGASASFVLSVPAGSASVAWTVAAGLGNPWVTVAPASGSLAAGQTTTVTATLNATADALGNNTWRDTLVITDATNQVTVSRPLTLRVAPNYRITSETFAWITPDSPTTLPFADDAINTSIILPFNVPFYGNNRSALTIGSNGLIGFGDSSGIISPSNSALPSSATPNELLAVWWDDLDPSVTGSIEVGVNGTTPNRVAAVSWIGVPHYLDASATNPYTFQAVFEEATGDLVCQYQEVRPTDSTHGRGRSATIGVENSTGDLARQYSYLGSTLLSNSQALRYHFVTGTDAPANAAPTVASAASSTPTTAIDTFATVSVLGADDNGEANLSYTWSLAGKATSVFTVRDNGRHSAASTTIDFTQAGAYPLRATITDAGGKSVISNVTVTVAQTLTALAISPATVSLPNGTTVDFTALGFDQFADAISAEPAVIWTITSGPGSINSSTGLYTANGQGSATIQAQNGALTASATITITNGAPTIVTAADTSDDPVSGTTTDVTVLGTDDDGEPALTYTWSTTGTPPAAVAFSPNGTHAAQLSTATFSKAGTYILRATISDPLLASVTSDVTVTVAQTVTGLAIDPRSVTVAPRATLTFTGRDGDQFGDPIVSSTRAVTWATAAGAITSAGEFTAPGRTGTVTITATATVGGQTATSTVTVATSGSAGGGGGGGGGCGFGATAAALAALLALTWRRRRLGD